MWEPVKGFITSEATWAPNKHTVIWKAGGNIPVCVTSQRGLWKPVQTRRAADSGEEPGVQWSLSFQGVSGPSFIFVYPGDQGTSIHYSDFQVSLSGYY